MNSISLYIHIPFCARKCYYCDFLSFDQCTSEKTSNYIKALNKEIYSYKDDLEEYEISTIFIGGGTPSLIDVKHIYTLFETINKSFVVSKDAEITIECNPGTVNKDKIAGYKSCGINRISLGLQSTHNRLLNKIGRIHNYEAFLNNYQMVRRSGFDNVNIDLMFALPTQTKEEWIESLKTVMELEPEHLSIYSLIIEENTKFMEWYEKGIIKKLDEDCDRSMYWDANRILSESGYNHYEISNYSKNGYACKHNKVYWKMKPYLGFGIGAASYFNDIRSTNIYDINQYIAANGNRKIIIGESDKVTNSHRKEESMFLGLRMMEGVSKEWYYNRFQNRIEDDYKNVLEKLLREGLIKEKNGFIQLTHPGINVSNYVFEKFLF